mmetsp:Transcript_101047/g.185084  ORF Transcript_101047/g.185084 Transcript_101047/m.185084 type:complete len:202 (+) Transcript_101047:236-841(+)
MGDNQKDIIFGPARKIHVAEKRVHEKLHPCVHISSTLTIRESIEEAPELFPFFCRSLHDVRILVIAEVLLPQIRFEADALHTVAQLRVYFSKRILCSLVGTHKGHDILVLANELSQLPAGLFRLQFAFCCQRHLIIWNSRIRVNFHIPKRLTMPHQDDGSRPLPHSIVSCTFDYQMSYQLDTSAETLACRSPLMDSRFGKR